MNKALLLLLSVALVWSASSCKLYRRISGRKSVLSIDSSLVTIRDSVLSTVDTAAGILDHAVAVVPVPRSVDSALLQKLLPLWNKQTDWSTFSGKARVHYEGKGESQDVSATIRMEKGKRVWISVVALGMFEAARVLITPDTIQIMNKLQKEVTILPFSESSKLLPIRADFASLQSLIIGDVLQTGQQPTDAADSSLALVLSHVSADFTQSLQFDKQDTALRLQAISTAGTFMLSEYSDYNKEAARRFSNNRNISMNDKGELFNIHLEFSKAAFNEVVEMPFSVPEKYERK